MSVAPVSTARLSPRAVSDSSVIEQTGAEPLPATDTLWRDVYHVGAPLPAIGDAQLWRAHRTDTAEEVVLRVTPGAKGDARSAAWTHLCTLELAHLQRAREIHFSGGSRVEVCDALHGTALDEWRGARSSVDVAMVEAVVRQISEALGVLHASGLVHLGLRPGAIWVREENGKLHCTLGSLDTVALFEGDQPLPLAVDPLYAPPEAAALELHEPGPEFCAWDWWSLGRVAQELILGHPVIDDLPDADPTETAPMRVARAEQLLLESAGKGLRAGGLEAMPALEPRLKLLLRGLLASSPEVRWEGDVVDRWVRQMPVKEHYDTPRIEKKFRWRGRLHTVAGAAKELQSAALWVEAGPHIFEGGRPGTLANFIGKSPEQKTVALQLVELLKLAESEPLRSLPPEVAREVLATVALLLLSGGNLVWRGRRLDGESLIAMLAEEPDNPARFAFVRALTHRSVTAQIERHDFAASRSLAQVGRCAADAEAIIRRNGWLTGADEAAGEKIFRLALEPEATLLAACARLRRDFACSSQPTIEKIFKAAKPARVELVVLAWIEPLAAHSGFVTQADWEAGQLHQLRERSGSIVTALFWARWGRALAAGPGLFGPGPAVLAGWGGAALLIAALWPGPRLLAVAFAPALLVLVARRVFSLVPATALRRFAPAARPWKWTDGVARCAAEIASAGKGLDAAGLERALNEINAEIAKLKLANPAQTLVTAPPHFTGTRSAAFASWALIAAVALGGAWRFKIYPPSWETIQFAWFPSQAAAAASKSAGAAGASADVVIAAPLAEEATRKGTDVTPGDFKVSWPYRWTNDFEPLAATETLEATKAQTAYAMQRGRAIVAPYRPETINAFVVFEVPAGDKIGVMIFDGAHGTLAVARVFILAYRPLARSWVELVGRKCVVIPE